MRTIVSEVEAVVRRAVPAKTAVRAGRPALLWWGWAAALFLLYAAVGARRQALIRTTGYDLGIFEQAVKQYAQLRAPIAPLRGDGFNLLGDHFHPVLVVLAPLYRLAPSPYTLLFAQAALLAVAVVPLARRAHQVLGRRAAHVIAFGYGLSWGIASAVAFDFHEVCFAVPLVAYALEALALRRWRLAVAWAAPLLLVKEDLGLTLAAIGGYIAWQGRRRLGLVTAAAGLLGSALEFKVLMPFFSPAGTYAHAANLEPGHGSLLTTLALAPLDAVRPEVKATTLVLVFAPAALIALRSPLAWLAVPTLGWRMLSQNPFHWGTSFHYTAVLMPVVLAALTDALAPYRRSGDALARRHVRASLATTLAVTAVLLPSFPLAQLAHRSTWRSTAHVAAARDLLRRIPDGATVAASNRLVPQLTSRTDVVLFPTYPVHWRLYDTGAPVPPPTAQWIVYDRVPAESWPYPPGYWPYPRERQEAELIKAEQAYGYRVVAQREGITLLRR
ncbi:DUF2079 domain-containing protein [Streptomyces sp. CBMA152]|uniref:DUF2079 domain-containing protein n=1 Tax=Streptomyces sp. CBMA152 TaxID=1896312 RepID=UPI0016615EC6|nr:DUF2079 domain-containing protein [Streptomyces sp. CBMA152]